MKHERINEDTLVTAATLWEAAIDAMRLGWDHLTAIPKAPLGKRLTEFRERNGTATLREMIAEMAPTCDEAWSRLSDDERDQWDTWDWDFVPWWLENNFRH